MSILSVNAGSSSLKFALYPIKGEALGDALLSGNIEGLEPAGVPRITFSVQGKKQTAAVSVLSQQEPFEAALESLKQLLQTHFGNMALQAVVHRVVHGGQFFSAGVVVTPDVFAQLSTLNALAPLHQPHNLAGIRAFADSFQDVPQIACFDTAFHRTLSPLDRKSVV